MITKNDWDDALDAWVAEECERLGGPPTPEEVVAYLSGDLPDAEVTRIRALMVYYPDSAASVDTPLMPSSPGSRATMPRRNARSAPASGARRDAR